MLSTECVAVIGFCSRCLFGPDYVAPAFWSIKTAQTLKCFQFSHIMSFVSQFHNLKCSTITLVVSNSPYFFIAYLHDNPSTFSITS